VGEGISRDHSRAAPRRVIDLSRLEVLLRGDRAWIGKWAT